MINTIKTSLSVIMLVLVSSITVTFSYSLAQTPEQSIGLFTNLDQAYNGYTILAPTSSKSTYLINNCGEEINSWISTYTAGMMAYLLEDGSLMRAGRITSQIFQAGGIGGIIEKYSWDGELLWSYTLAGDSIHLHHDFEVLPNGNVLVIAWKIHSATEAISRGRNPLLTGVNVWTTYILEIEPTYPEGGQIVWSWDAFDHLVQNYDTSLPSFGNPKDFPDKIDVNFEAVGGLSYGARDWLHANSIDYNPSTGEILLSMRSFNELWIIKRGVDSGITYRWGNPMAYNRGTVNDKKLFKQHDCHWIKNGLLGAGDILFYNNGSDRPAGSYSSVDQMELPLLINGVYPLNANDPYGPENSIWTYPETLTSEFFSQNISGVQRLPNDNTLICEGASGHLFEVNELQEIVWDYINPISVYGPLTQGSTPFINSVFRSIRYAPNHPALAGRDLTPLGPLELEPLPMVCTINYAPTCPADLNYDYFVSVADLMIAVSTFGCNTNCLYDVDGDGTFGISDMLVLLTAFGSSC